MIVVDASAILELLLQTDLGARVEARLVREAARWHAPALLDTEVLQGLRRLLRQGALDAARAGQAVGDLMDLELVRHGHVDLGPRIWELRSTHTAYDATYVALAEALDASLVTCDRPLSRSHGHTARIQLVS